jgi:P-type Cu+ transporter
MSDKTILKVEGMTCSNCAQGISRYLEKKGLREVQVDFTTGEVVFEEIQSEEMPEVIHGIEQLGYHVHGDETESKKPGRLTYLKSIEFRLLFCAIFTLPLLLHMFIDWHPLHQPVVQLILSLPVFTIGMLYFGKSALASLRSGIPNMDVLITIGSVAAFIYSLAGMYLYAGTGKVSSYLFFETSATIITLVLLGNLIEKRSVRRTTSAIRELMEMQPQFAHLITIEKDLSETVNKVSVDEIKKHDLILVHSGDVIPVDGRIYWGAGSVDESAMTGESMPVTRQSDDQVLAGTLLVDGTIKVQTLKSGNQTALSGIVELVRQAQRSKPAIQKLGDRVSAWFVTIVLFIAIATFVGSYIIFGIDIQSSLMRSIAVLVISCPCAMGLATPTAVAVGLGKAARKGILIKGGTTLEAFSGIRTAVFDKTGTLTTGKFRIREISTYDFSRQDAVNLLYSLEQHSSHPLAVSLVTGLEKEKNTWVSFSGIEEIKGIGIRAKDENGVVYTVGSVQIAENAEEIRPHNIFLKVNDRVVASVDMADDIKEGANEMIKQLIDNGIEPVLLSGDRANRCNEVASALGIVRVYAEKLPEQKAEIIQQLKSEGKVLMVGDGINDAPSLALADIGVSFSEATKIAINSAQVVILHPENMTMLLDALRIGKQTLRTIKQNLFWAFAYNVVAIPVAAAGMLSPMVAALSMAFSDVMVIGNSLRIRIQK